MPPTSLITPIFNAPPDGAPEVGCGALVGGGALVGCGADVGCGAGVGAAAGAHALRMSATSASSASGTMIRLYILLLRECVLLFITGRASNEQEHVRSKMILLGCV